MHQDEKHKMITNLRENRTPRNQDSSANDGKITKASSSSRTWSGLKDPRVVRVSHAFKGKDRHSKVYTIKGLRDRRIRLSVPTAIQLYDLQERLGLNQPSKVVDWLLNAAKHEIDELPPLQIPPGNFGPYHQMLASQEVDVPKASTNPFVDENTTYVKYDETHSSLPCKEGLKINNNIDTDYQTTTSTFWDSDALLKAKFREFAGETVVDKNNWIKRNDPEKQEGNEGTSAQASSHSSFQRSSHSLPGFLNNFMPFNPYYHWEPSNLSLCHRGNHGLSIQTEEPQSYNVVSLPSSLPLPPGSQLLVCPSGTTPSFLPPCVASPLESNARQINHFQMLSPSSQNPPPNSLTPPLFSISQPTRPFQLSSMPQKLLHPFSTRASQQEAENTTPSSTLAATFFQFDPKAMHG